MWLAMQFGIMAAAGAAETDLRTFEVRGVVERLILDKGEAVIRHDAIPGYMKAMTMPFRAKESQDLAGLKPGDTITLTTVDRQGASATVKIKLATRPANL